MTNKSVNLSAFGVDVLPNFYFFIVRGSHNEILSHMERAPVNLVLMLEYGEHSHLGARNRQILPSTTALVPLL
jgi:hypothetical protein